MSILTKNKINRGFSLLELLIVISIFTIITTIALFNQGKLNSDVLLTNLAYDVALTIREAQSYGVGTKYLGVDVGYGIYINILSNKDEISVFHDLDGDGIYTAADGVAEKTYKFENQRGNQMDELCATGGSENPLGPDQCDGGLSGLGYKISDMSITFKRPDPEAHFKAGNIIFGGPAYIVLKSQDKTNCRAVVIESSGQVRVEGSDSVACHN